MLIIQLELRLLLVVVVGADGGPVHGTRTCVKDGATHAAALWF